MPKRYPHILLIESPTEFPFTSSSIPIKKRIPTNRNRQIHSDFLREKLDNAWAEARSEQVVHHADRNGIYLEFRGEPGFDLVTKSLEDLRSKKIRLLNVRKNVSPFDNAETTIATVFVANEKKDFFFDRIERYAREDTKKGAPKHSDLIDSISNIRKADKIESFWVDNKHLIPEDEARWCEIWLMHNGNPEETIERFDQLLEQFEIQSRSGYITFPERLVKVILADNEKLERLIIHSGDVAEFRGAKETASFWTEMRNFHQAEWVKDLQERTKIQPDCNTSVCILDTGVNNGHPLLAPLFSDADCQSVDQEWGTYDHDGHGSLMAGVAAYGDLASCLAASSPVEIRHCLESVKIYPLPPQQTEPELWGDITSQGIFRAEIKAPQRNRIVCMGISAADTRDQGRPSSWSGQLDQLASGSEDETRRLLIVCAGNINDLESAKNYPEAQIQDSVHDPGQAWNVLTVGAYTCLDQITDLTMSGYQPIAPREGLSPFTTTSWAWQDMWPIKPEIVMEGGNLAQDEGGFVSECDDLSLVSTYYKPQTGHFHPFRMTSASTAYAAWFAANIQARYPDFWPETIRALMVHSAKWPEQLKKQFAHDDKKNSIKRLMRICGYGVPDLDQALFSAANSLTLVAQEMIQPFDKKENASGFRTRDMHFYDLPWPKETLLELPSDTMVEMKVTLSYFIEPGPGEIGWKDRYRYASHGLRFHLNSPQESQDEFVKRVNVAARLEDEEKPDTQSASKYWVIGTQTRNRGSVHSDIWKGTAAELAGSNMIAVAPTIGWWRERSHLKKWDKKTRYSLVVTIKTPEETVDIYTRVAIKMGIIGVPVEIEISSSSKKS
jgi:hypothetical protein